jgi:divalent metal cation (Fe/Co/Zn/Cd) transporter
LVTCAAAVFHLVAANYISMVDAAVTAALGANSLIFVVKMAAWCFSGGSALLAEAIHSLADIGNQAMLRVGIYKAAQAPTAQHPFGHMREKFIFRFVPVMP